SRRRPIARVPRSRVRTTRLWRRSTRPRKAEARSRPKRLELMAKRPLLIRFGWTLRDYIKRVWDNSGEDNVLFLAGGIAFNLILAAVPFVLLLAAGVTYLLPLVVRSVQVNST